MIAIDLYGAEWCPDCRITKAYLDQNGISYNYIDISVDESAAQKVQEINKGKRIIPTVLIEGVAFANPSQPLLQAELIKAQDAKSFKSSCGIERSSIECGDESDY